MSPPSLPRDRCASLWLAGLALAVVLAQALGFMHRVAHAPAEHAPVHAGMHAEHGSGAEDDHGAGADWLPALFGGHQEGQECPLHDPLSQPGGLVVLSLALAQLPACTLLAASHADFVARWASLFDARGPPGHR